MSGKTRCPKLSIAIPVGIDPELAKKLPESPKLLSRMPILLNF